jgi:hypothetical protein
MLESGVKSRFSRSGLFSRSFTPFDPINDQRYYVEIFNTGTEKLDYTISSKEDWIRLSSPKGSIQYEEKVLVSINWNKIPTGITEGEIKISGANRDFTVRVPVRRIVPTDAKGFIENNGIVSIDAINFQRATGTKNISWEIIPNLGRTGSAITTLPVTSSKQNPGKDAPYLEYKIFLLDSGVYNLEAWFSPTLNFQKDDGLVYALSIDGEAPQMMNLHESAKAADWTYPKWWNDAVTDNIMKQAMPAKSLSAGTHTIRYWMADPGLVLQKIVLKKSDVDSQSYLGPPESKIIR